MDKHSHFLQGSAKFLRTKPYECENWQPCESEALARDLRDGKQYPRSPRETLGGYVLAARAVDKCRAVLARSQGDYHSNCPLDQIWLKFAEIDYDAFRSFVATGATDDAIAVWISFIYQMWTMLVAGRTCGMAWRRLRVFDAETRDARFPEWRLFARAICGPVSILLPPLNLAVIWASGSQAGLADLVSRTTLLQTHAPHTPQL